MYIYIYIYPCIAHPLNSGVQFSKILVTKAEPSSPFQAFDWAYLATADPPLPLFGFADCCVSQDVERPFFDTCP